MLIIRIAQIDALAKDMDRNNAIAIRHHLSEREPAELEGDTAEIDHNLVQAALLARRMGVQALASAASLYRLQRHVHPRCAEHPAIAELLFGDSVEADARPSMIFAFASREEWRQRCIEVFGD